MHSSSTQRSDCDFEKDIFLDFRSEDLYPMTFLTVSILEQLWSSRVEKKISAWSFVHAQAESQILLLRKGRLAQFADEAYLMLDATSPIVINT